jgi:hypothetical protein
MPQGPIRFLLSRPLSSARFKERLRTRWYRHFEQVVDHRAMQRWGGLDATEKPVGFCDRMRWTFCLRRAASIATMHAEGRLIR